MSDLAEPTHPPDPYAGEPDWARWVPTLLTVAIIATMVQPRIVIEALELRMAGYMELLAVNPLDFVLIPFALIAGYAALKYIARRRITLAEAAITVLALGGIISLIVHPSLRGVVITYRLDPLAVVWCVRSLAGAQIVRNVALPMLAVAAAEGVVEVAQLKSLGPVLPTSIGAWPHPVVTDGVLRAAGTFGHAYELSAFSLVAVGLAAAVYPLVSRKRRLLWLAAIAVATMPAALSFSRGAVLALAVMVAALGLGMAIENKRWGLVGAALVIGFIVPSLAFASSWTSRVDQSLAGSNVSGADLRSEQFEQAIDLMRTDWLVGVGPGRYGVELESRVELDPDRAFPVHNLFMYVGAESGIIVGLLFAGLYGLLGIAALRSGTSASVLYASPLAAAVFDIQLYISPIGLFAFCIWLGGLAYVIEWSAVADAASMSLWRAGRGLKRRSMSP